MNTWVTWLMLLVLSCGIAESQSDPRALLMGLVDRLTGSPSEGSAAALANEGNDAIEEDKRDADLKVPAPVPPGVPPAVQPITIPLPIPPPLPPLPPPIQLPVPPQLLPNTITATKTLYAEVTKRITRHPVCMTVYGVKPPCLPVILHAGHHPCPHYDPSCYKNDDNVKEEKELLWDDEPQEGFYIQPTASLRIPPATTAFDLVENAEERTEEEEEDMLELQPSRESRYLEFRKPTPAPPSVPVAVQDQEAASDTSPRRLINLGPTTQTVTKTLWVTKVQKVIDYRVTATLEAKNCVPTDLKLPFCQPPTPPPSHKPPPHKPPHYKPTPPPHYSKPPSPSYQPQPAYQPEPPKPAYQPEPPKPSYQPEPPPLSYQPPKPAYQPELPQPGYFPEPPSYYVEPLLPSYQPEPPHLGYKPPVPPPIHWKEGEEEKKTESPAETNDETASENPEEGST